MAEATSSSSSRDQVRIGLGSQRDQVWDQARDQLNLAICVSVQIALIMRKRETQTVPTAREGEREGNTNKRNNYKRCNKTEIGMAERERRGTSETWMNEAGREVKTKWFPFKRAIPSLSIRDNCPDSCLWLLCKQTRHHTLPARGYLSALFELQY